MSHEIDIQSWMSRHKGLPRRERVDTEVFPILEKLTEPHGITMTRTDDMYTDGVGYRLVLPTGTAVNIFFPGLELLQNSGERLPGLVERRFYGTLRKIFEPFDA